MTSVELPADYISGFVDGEGCFALKYRIDRQANKGDGRVREYYYWTAEFAVALHPHDAQLLSLIKDTLGVGKISFTKAGDQVRYSVQNIKELNDTIVPFFEQHKLYGMKTEDFILWGKAVRLIHTYRSQAGPGRSKPVSEKVQGQLESIRSEMSIHKSRKNSEKTYKRYRPEKLDR